MTLEEIQALVAALDGPLCSTETQPMAALASGGCWACHNRVQEQLYKETGDWTLRLRSVFMVCSSCGNKRCPRANWHGYECTKSSDTGQIAVGNPPPENVLLENHVDIIKTLLAHIEGTP